jgi:hypothetical protein
MIVKQGDTFPVSLTVNHDLTGATTRLVVRHLRRDGELETLPTTDTGTTVTFELDGTWQPGYHFIELEITRDGEVRTAPTDDTFTILVKPDLDNR